jgi:hypothetical protein
LIFVLILTLGAPLADKPGDKNGRFFTVQFGDYQL